MKLTILGSGTAFPKNDRGSAGYLLEADGKKMLFDTGLGTLYKLEKKGIDPREITHIFYSHLHNDHTCDLAPMLWYLFVVPKHEPDSDLTKNVSITICGPEGTKGYVDLIWRKVLGREGACPFIKDVVEIDSGSFDLDNIHISTEPVVHMCPTVAYKIENKGKSFVYSGDLERCEGIEKLSKEADLLLLECGFPKTQEVEKHMNTTQCGKLAKDRGVRKLVLTHLYPGVLAVDAVAETKEQFDGEIIKAEDLMEIEI